MANSCLKVQILKNRFLILSLPKKAPLCRTENILNHNWIVEEARAVLKIALQLVADKKAITDNAGLSETGYKNKLAFKIK